jgi:hypothetical protein
VHFVLYPTYIRGKSYLSAKQGAAAAIEFQKILDHPGLVGNEPIAALAHLELGRAYALSGEKARANTAYQEFFSLWKDAASKGRIRQPAMNGVEGGEIFQNHPTLRKTAAYCVIDTVLPAFTVMCQP